MYPKLCCLLLLSASFVSAADPEKLQAAKALFADGHLHEAQTAFDQLAAADPGDAELCYWQGRTALLLNQLDRAIALLEKAVAKMPNQARCHHALGDAYGLGAQKASLFSKMGFAKKCIASFNRAVELEPDNVEYRKSRYEFYRAAPAMVGGGTDKAAAEIAEIEKRDPVQGAGIRADLLLKDGKTDEAFSVIESLRAKFPERQVSLFQLGRLAAMTGQHLDDGEKALRQYLHYSPQDSEPPLWSAHWRLAMILEKKGNVSDARTHYETTLQLNPCFTRARESLARLPLAAPSSLPGR